MSDVEITLALPTYNEADNIESVVQEAATSLGRLGRKWELLVIDNFSSDDTPQIVSELAKVDPCIRLIRHDRNRQYSGSCATAIREARGSYIAIMDSDGQALAEDLPLFIERIDGGANLVFGWRKERKDPFTRLAISAIFNWLGKLRLRYPFHDLNCGYRMFDREYAAVAEIKHEINFANPELFARARIANLRIDEVVVEHRPREGGGSSHNFLRMWRMFSDVDKYFSSLRKEMRDAATRD